MRLKKSYDKDLNHRSGFYFVLGLVLILTLIYAALEWKTEDDNRGYDMGIFPKKEITKKDSAVVLKTQARQPHSNQAKSFQKKQ